MRNPLTFQCWTNVFPNGQAATPMKLTEGQLHVEQRKATQHQHNAVGNQKGATSIFIANIRKPPHIAQVHSEPDNGQQELGLLTPVLSGRIRGHRHLHHAVLVGLHGQTLRLQRIAVFGGRRMCFARVPIVTPVAVRVVRTRPGIAVIVIGELLTGIVHPSHCGGGGSSSDGTVVSATVSIREQV